MGGPSGADVGAPESVRPAAAALELSRRLRGEGAAGPKAQAIMEQLLKATQARRPAHLRSNELVCAHTSGPLRASKQPFCLLLHELPMQIQLHAA